MASIDTGLIIDGVVKYDVVHNEYIVMGDEGEVFSLQETLMPLVGKKVRVTCVTFETIQNLEKLLSGSGIKIE